nr:hypothetical protein [Tanacetum cinerariifolium]
MDTYATLTRRVEHLEFDQVAQALEITKLKKRVQKLERRNKVRVLKLRRLQKVGTSQRVETSDDNVMDDESNLGRMIAEMDQDDDVVLEDDKEEDRKVADAVKDVEEAKEDETEPTEVQEVVDVVTTAKLITKVVTTASETVTAAIVTASSRRRKGVVIRDPEEESTTSTIIPAKTKSKDKGKWILAEEPKPLKKKQQIEQDEQYARELHVELNKDIDWDKAIVHVKLKAKEDHAVKKYQAMKRKPQTEVQARKNMMMYLKNVVGFKMDYFKGMSYDDIRLIFEANFNSNVAFLLKTKEEIEEDVNRALQNLNKTPAERAAKRRKLDEEVEELKRHLQIVPNEDDDVYTEATPLARKLMIRKKVGDLLTHTTKYTSPALTQKVFANMRRVGKGLSGVKTPLFEGMLLEQQVVEEGDADENDEIVNAGDAAKGDVSAAHREVLIVAEEPSIPSPTPPTPPPQPSQDIPSTSQVQPTPPQSPQIQPPSPQPQQDAGIPMNLLQDQMDTCTALTRKVEHLEFDKVAQAIKITKLKQRVKKLERRNKGMMITDMDADVDGRTTESQAEIYKIDLDHANKVLCMHEDETKPAEVQEVVDVVTTAKIITEVVTAASETITDASTNITSAEA